MKSEMKSSVLVSLIVGLGLVLVAQGRGQTAEPESPVMTLVRSQENQGAVPRVVKLTGVLTDSGGKPLSGEVQVTFTLYKQETDEAPLWTETQRLEADKQGGYTALLGATKTDGLPAELFRSEEARWLGVQVEGQPQQSRILFVSVPYALKAIEAERLGGKSVSDFVLSESLGEQVRQVIQAQSLVVAQPTLAVTPQQKLASRGGTASPQMSPPGSKFPPSTFSGTTSDQIVLVKQSGSGAGLVALTPQSNALVGQSTGGNGVSGQTASTSGSGVVGIATSTSTSSYHNGVYGQNAGAGAGVAGIATNPAAGVGVYGQSASFAGVFGNATVTSGNVNGVYGQSASPNASGVVGDSTATSGFTSGVFGKSASSNGTGVFGTSVNWVGVGGQATATSGSPAFGVWGDTASTDGAGVAGFADATSGFPNGVFGQSVSTNGTGVLGVNNAADAGVGVSGIANGTTGDAYGVSGATSTTGFGAGAIGVAIANTGTAFGVFARASSPNGNAVFGHAASTSGFPAAVVGFLDSNDGGVAGQFVAHGGSGLILQGLSGSSLNQVFSLDANGNLTISGNLVVSGGESEDVKLQNGRDVALYAVESPESWFEDFGSGELNDGVAWVPFDGSFAQATNAAVTYHVFLTANGDTNGLYVSRKTPAGFEVREHGVSGSNVAFDYRIVAKRRGYETIRMAEVQKDVNAIELSRQHLAGLANSGSLKTMGTVKMPRIAPASAIRPVLPRPNVPQPPRPR